MLNNLNDIYSPQGKGAKVVKTTFGHTLVNIVGYINK